MRYLAALCAVLAPAAILAVTAGCISSRAPDASLEPGLTALQKIEISRDALPAIERRFGKPLEDLAVQAYVRMVGERLSSHTPMHE
jgi:hypothetical protein